MCLRHGWPNESVSCSTHVTGSDAPACRNCVAVGRVSFRGSRRRNRKENSMSKSKKDSPKAVGTTNSGPSHPGAPANDVAQHGAEQQALAEAFPHNAEKPAEYGYENAIAPPEGSSAKPPSPTTGAGTLT